jgi:Glycosyl hydrolase family 99/Glycosyltransferase WbsX
VEIPYQPETPIVGAFFYPWFPSAWKQQGFDPFTNYHPTLGFYSSMDDEVIDEQLTLATRAGIDAMISSWWGAGDDTDTALAHIMTRSGSPNSVQPNMRFAVYYEAEGSRDPTVEEILGDLDYLERSFFKRSNYLLVDGKPVLFVYADAKDGSAMTARWAEAKTRFAADVYVVLKVFPGYKTDPNQPDAWHQYAPAEPIEQTQESFVISPGFWKKGEEPRLERDPVRFEESVVEMLNTNATFYLIATWNEWGEGTAVEPSEEFGATYVDILCRHLNDDANACASLKSKGRLQVAASDTVDCFIPATKLEAFSLASSETAGENAYGVLEITLQPDNDEWSDLAKPATSTIPGEASAIDQ